MVVVEAKRIDRHTKEEVKKGQISAYVKNVRTAQIAVLTNGEYWHIEVKKERGRWEMMESPNALGLLWRDVEDNAKQLYDSLGRLRFIESGE